ncbi:MAG TPA: Erv1/Alr family FAD-linked sulfhydryl oxidase [Candidatus Saccharimonadales bacterium]|nr:Erv1/Alr family FAD-linked sulfhydryl oxidase [Candidatus Saccharimonadales bacterium]
MNDNFNIKTEGRGIWFVIHTLAYHATTESAKQSFTVMINQLSDHFGCDTCKPDFKKFITDKPLKEYWHQEYGFFKWSWELHNMVNQKLKKPLYHFDHALLKYKSFVCQHCDNNIKNAIIEQVSDVNQSDMFNLLSYY